MNCFDHFESVAVATCQDCQKGLCVECSRKYSSPICTQCNLIRIEADRKAIYKEFAITFIVGLILYFVLLAIENDQTRMGNTQNSLGGSKIMLLYICFTIVSGWRTLNKLTSNYFLFLPIIGWFFYFIVKFFLSGLIGWFVFPIRLVKNIKRLIELKNIPI